MKLEIISYFDESNNPARLLQAPGVIEEEIIDEIFQLLRREHKETFFIHSFKHYKSANILIEMDNPEDNKKELLLISMIITEGIIDYKITKKILEGFSEEILKIDKLYHCLYLKSKKYEDYKDKFSELQKLFFNFSKSYPEDNLMFKKEQDLKIFIYGLDQAGKTALLNGLKRNLNFKTLPTTNVDISRINVKRISLITYDAPGQLRFHGLWEPYLKMKQDGLVFVMDVVHRMRYNAAKNLLHEIANRPNLKNLPLLILFNKIDLVKPDIEQLIDEMDIDIIQARPIKYFLTSAIQNIGIDEAFEWLVQEISNQMSQEQ